MNDHIRPHEWRCVCGCINDDGDYRCWECRSDTDGNPPPTQHVARCDNVDVARCDNVDAHERDPDEERERQRDDAAWDRACGWDR